MSSIVPTGSILAEMRWEEVSEPWREMDFLFRVRFRSSRKRGFRARELGPGDLGEVGGTGEEEEEEEENDGREGGGVWDSGGGERGLDVNWSYWTGLLGRRFRAGGGIAPFFSELCFHDDDSDVGADLCN